MADQLAVAERNILNNTVEPITPVAPQKPFYTKYKIVVFNPIKNGDSLTYQIKTFLLTSPEDTNNEFCVTRQFTDVEYLHRTFASNPDMAGTILPPLPVKPDLDCQAAESSSRKQLGSRSKLMLGDCFNKDCRALQKYLTLMAAHWLVGNTTQLYDFLTAQKYHSRPLTRYGVLTRLTSAVETSRRSNKKDIDEIFQRERDKSSQYSLVVSEAAEAFREVLNAQLRVSACYSHLSTVLLMGGKFTDQQGTHANKLLMKLSDIIDDAKHGNDVDLVNSENTLGFHLSFTQRYTDSIQDMHKGRVSLLIDYEEANRLLEKAKPYKRHSAEDTKLKIQRQCEDSSERARREIVRYKQQHVLGMQEALTMYAEAKVKTARDTYALLSKALLAFQQAHK